MLMAEEMSGAKEVLTIQMAASGLMNVEVLSKSDPFLEISRSTVNGQWLPVFRTEVRLCVSGGGRGHSAGGSAVALSSRPRWGMGCDYTLEARLRQGSAGKSCHRE